MTDRIINFPEINWEKLREGAISKEMVWDELEKGVKFLLEVQMLKKTSFLSRDTIEKANEVSGKMRELKDQYPQIVGVVQNILGRQIKDRAAQNGDSRTLFSRLNFLVNEAVFYGSLTEWAEKDLGRVPVGLKKNFGIQLHDPRTRETRYFLPKNWRNGTHKSTALVLHDLSFRARDTYKAERVPAETPKTPKTPAKPIKTEPPAKTTKPRTTPKSRKPKKGAKAALRTESRRDDDDNEIRDARGKFTKDFAEIESILPAEKK